MHDESSCAIILRRKKKNRSRTNQLLHFYSEEIARHFAKERRISKRKKKRNNPIISKKINLIRVDGIWPRENKHRTMFRSEVHFNETEWLTGISLDEGYRETLCLIKTKRKHQVEIIVLTFSRDVCLTLFFYWLISYPFRKSNYIIIDISTNWKKNSCTKNSSIVDEFFREVIRS